MIAMRPSELFEPIGIDADYLSFLINEHRNEYPGPSAILRMTYYTSAATFRMIRLLKNLYPAGLCINGWVLWAEVNPDGSYTRRLITREEYEEAPPSP